MQSLRVDHLVGNGAILVGKGYLLGSEARGYVHGQDNQTALPHPGQVLLQPTKSGLVAVAHVVELATYVEIIIDDNVMHLPEVEAVVVGAEISLKCAMRGFVAASVIVHVVVANDAIDGHCHRLNALEILGKEPWTIAHNVATVQAQHITVGD